ncbi:uncharacterized protein DFL_003853 [Arthrobotrys flagrans]|uniref:Uncharacterized protein n=1 Tax=Arthrobotrys flagrans TaxID=97331 RepID=A0A437A317_ARTFL|nr:hypothetical protein DFL_003853 [Arthrobotrys flagrans]
MSFAKTEVVTNFNASAYPSSVPAWLNATGKIFNPTPRFSCRCDDFYTIPANFSYPRPGRTPRKLGCMSAITLIHVEKELGARETL